MHIQEQCSGVSRERRKSSTREGTEPNIKRIIPGTDIQQGDEDRRIRTTLLQQFFFFFFYSICNRVYDVLLHVLHSG